MYEYQKPGMTPLGDAAALIQGSKIGAGDSQDTLHQIAQTEGTED
jgi:hypothetical protein